MPRVSLTDLIAGTLAGTQVVSFPTDTIPALATRPDRADLLFQTKQRGRDKPLILMAADIDTLWSYLDGSEAEQNVWRAVAQRYWPGALTLVLPASDRVPPTLNPQDPRSIGVRIPHYDLARQILRQTGPLATTSANLSGQPALLSLDEIATQFPGVLTLAREEMGTLEAPPRVGGTPSTVIRWMGRGWELLRQGAVVLDLGMELC